ncbi:helix-turn-helix domain-containing protein [Schnuerera ultunensis]|uniref:helix-turn-helix domain-containing protein n=1 Tax=Schnuerera ultunensis TaxID=45497 RepID=UPI0003F6A68B|nr:helix-turn-helix transcriptional regulator [Schnuerera ultunensis]
MYYNLQAFGEEARSIRTNLGFTQKDVCELSGIHEDTLRKIENGKVIPIQKTLDLLSPILKKDLNQLLLNYRLNNYQAFEEIRNRLESKIDRDEYQTLSVELDDLKALLHTESNTYFINLINQLILLIESIILNKKYSKINEALDKLIAAMKITTPEFSLNNYKNLIYSSMESRILMNIALLINKIESTEKSLEIMEFCIQIVDPNEKLYPKICYNLSYTYHRLDIHESALKYSDLGIDYCIQHRDYNGLNLLYFRKGVAEYLLSHNYSTLLHHLSQL